MFFHLEACDLKEDIVQSLQLLKSSVLVTDDNKVCLLDTEHYPEGFKTKVCALLDTGNKDAEHLNEEAVILEATSTGGPLLTDFKTLNGEEKNYIVHLTCVHLQLAHQRNQLLHWFYIPAMAAFAGQTCRSYVSEGMCLVIGGVVRTLMVKC